MKKTVIILSAIALMIILIVTIGILETAIIILSIIALVRILAIYSPFFSKIWIRIKKAGVPITKVFAYLVTIWCLIWGGFILDDPDFKLFEYLLIGVGIVGIGCMIVDFKHYICKKRHT